MAVWLGREIVGMHETVPLIGHRLASSETGLLKVGFLFFGDHATSHAESRVTGRHPRLAVGAAVRQAKSDTRRQK